MIRHLFILSGRDPDLYSYLRERFADDPAVELIVDRRRPDAACTPAHYPVDRRTRPDADAELLSRSYTVITIPEFDIANAPPRARRRDCPVESSSTA